MQACRDANALLVGRFVAKKFEDDRYYRGRIMSVPFKSGGAVTCRIQYIGRHDTEDVPLEEVEKMLVKSRGKDPETMNRAQLWERMKSMPPVQSTGSGVGLLLCVSSFHDGAKLVG